MLFICCLLFVVKLFNISIKLLLLTLSAIPTTYYYIIYLQVSKKRLKKYEKEYIQMKEELELKEDPAERLQVRSDS